MTCKQHLTQGTTFHADRTGENFTIRDHHTCQTSNIIYLLYCNICQNAQYVGETQNALSKRMYLHRSNINKNTGTHVTRHFNQPGHSLSNVKVQVIEKVFKNTKEARLTRERFWIRKLNTIWPLGLNSQEHS